MEFELTSIEGRVLGSLMEKAATTPEYYPLTMRALQAACNQRSNRSPVMELIDDDIQEALEELRLKQFVTQVSADGSRVVKYKYRLDPLGEVDDASSAIICVLLLRGAQTTGELRTRCARMYDFETISEVQDVVQGLIQWGGGALVAQLPREPGRRESRYCSLLAESSAMETVGAVVDQEGLPAPVARTSTSERIGQLEAELAQVREEMAKLREELSLFRSQFD